MMNHKDKRESKPKAFPQQACLAGLSIFQGPGPSKHSCTCLIGEALGSVPKTVDPQQMTASKGRPPGHPDLASNSSNMISVWKSSSLFRQTCPSVLKLKIFVLKFKRSKCHRVSGNKILHWVCASQHLRTLILYLASTEIEIKEEMRGTCMRSWELVVDRSWWQKWAMN